MEVPQNSYACAICQKTFNNLTILGKHVEFRHSSAEQPQKSKCGSVPKEKDPVITGNLDPLEISKDNNVTPFEFVLVQENVRKYPFKDEGQSEASKEEINNLHDNSSTNQVTENVKVVDFVFEKESLQFDKGNHGDATKTASFTKNDLVVTQKKTVLNQNPSEIVMNGGISKSQIHGGTPDSFVGTELNKVDNYCSSSLGKNATITIGKSANNLKPNVLKVIAGNYDSAEKLSKPELDKFSTPELENLSTSELEKLSTSELEKLSIPDLEKILEKLSTSELEKMPTSEPETLSRPDHQKVSTPELEKLSTPVFEAFFEEEDDLEDSSLNLVSLFMFIS